MKIGVLTYDIPHRKTQDILLRLIGKDVSVITTPFKARPEIKRLYSHRPNMNYTVSTQELCRRMGFTYYENYNPLDIIKLVDVCLIGGCGIIEPEDYKIINSHPGYLPYGRGLDSLKWSIYNGQPIGVTTHVIDENVDSGYLIDQRFLNVSYYDTFHSLAYRQYELEIEMLIESIEKPVLGKINDRGLGVNKRMPIELEPIMMDRFNKLKADNY